METVKKHFFSDMCVMLGRSMRHISRSMDTIITVCITPIAMMLLFVYVDTMEKRFLIFPQRERQVLKINQILRNHLPIL